jgi:hypothetical protein
MNLENGEALEAAQRDNCNCKCHFGWERLTWCGRCLTKHGKGYSASTPASAAVASPAAPARKTGSFDLFS